ncbi:hypothetical protein B1R32_10860 [Abditibacterium utsteinense]|uniref:Uncharacterized protein n=1 Tax=Abditibacterium utsteinense TaxID=1960156 RepID=A0A2S8SSR7_9BACT|nr:hypothetical protein [Abditibacterium utsteinense]PQV63853.1 hypothetical protein B1R32_10860 [Abditibacterium utsteinense]
MKKDLTKRDSSLAAAAVSLLLLGAGAGVVFRQKASANQEQHRMIVQMNLEMGRSPDASTDSPPESEGQSDPNFVP